MFPVVCRASVEVELDIPKRPVFSIASVAHERGPGTYTLYSTVTDLAKFLGLSTSVPFTSAT